MSKTKKLIASALAIMAFAAIPSTGIALSGSAESVQLACGSRNSIFATLVSSFSTARTREAYKCKQGQEPRKARTDANSAQGRAGSVDRRRREAARTGRTLREDRGLR